MVTLRADLGTWQTMNVFNLFVFFCGSKAGIVLKVFQDGECLNFIHTDHRFGRVLLFVNRFEAWHAEQILCLLFLLLRGLQPLGSIWSLRSSRGDLPVKDVFNAPRIEGLRS